MLVAPYRVLTGGGATFVQHNGPGHWRSFYGTRGLWSTRGEGEEGWVYILHHHNCCVWYFIPICSLVHPCKLSVYLPSTWAPTALITFQLNVVKCLCQDLNSVSFPVTCLLMVISPVQTGAPLTRPPSPRYDTYIRYRSFPRGDPTLTIGPTESHSARP